MIVVRARTLPEAWEKAMLALWREGVDFRTEYDRKDPAGNFIDPPSRDATAVIEVREPFGEPRIHKNFPGGPEELEVYRQEVVEGIHDHWIDLSDPDKWRYTYHERLFAYRPTENLFDADAPRLAEVNQIESVLAKALEACYSRRMQATTWMPGADPAIEHPPCLQRLWFRILIDEAGDAWLNLNTHWRSRDAYKAWFMNAFALTDLQKRIAGMIAERWNRPVKVGRYLDISDSFHLYGSYFDDFLPEFEKMEREPDYTTRAWPSDHPAFVMMTEETRKKLAEDPDYMRRAHR